MMTIKEIREKNPDQLRNELGERQKHLFDLRSQAVTEKLEDPSQLRKTRKEIARILTVLHERQLGGQASGTEGGEEAGSAGVATTKAPARRTRTAKRTRATKRPA